MGTKHLKDIYSRFEHLCQHQLEETLNCVPFIHQDEQMINVEFITDAGKLNYLLDLGKDVDDLSHNILGYTASLQLPIQIGEGNYQGIHLPQLERQIRSIFYMHDLDSKEVALMRQNILKTLEQLGKSDQTGAVEAKNAIIAKYGHQLRLEGMPNQKQIREDLLSRFRRQSYFSLTTDPVYPSQAYYQLMQPAGKSKERKISKRRAVKKTA